MARCPKCTESLHRGADGDYPAQCPKCGVRLKSKPKKSAAGVVAQTSAPPEAVGEERVVRSFSASRRTTVPAEAHFASPPAASEIGETDEERVDSDPEVLSDEVEEATPFLPSPEVNPFAPVETTLTSAPGDPVEEPNPFGGSSVTSKARRGPRTGIVKAAVAGILITAIVGFGYWFGKDALKPAPSKDRAGFQNPSRHYVFYALPSPWAPDQGRATRAGYELVLHRADLGGWITLRTEISKEEALDPRDVGEEVITKWKERVTDFAGSGQLGKMKLSGHDAVVVEGEGTLDGKAVRGRTLVLAASGIKYYLGFEGPIDEWDKLERDFNQARENLELTGGTVTPLKTLGEHQMAAFESQKFPYRITTPAGIWREVPDLQTDSRYDDMKLQDRARLGEIVVQPRITKDLPGMRVRYVDAKKRLFDDKVREVETAIEKLSIKGRPAMRTMMIVQSTSGDYMLYTTFVQGDGLVFQIQCRALLDKREVYEPIFERITGSFEILDRPTAPISTDSATTEKVVDLKDPPKQAAKAPLMQPPKVEPASSSPAKEESKKPETKTTEQKKPTEKKPADAAAKKPSEAEKKPEPTKKKKSLDDLD